MNKTIIIANWKCNPNSLKEAKNIFGKIKKSLSRFKKIEIVVCAPFVYLFSLKNIAGGNILLGAQDVFWEEGGAFTSQISSLMLKDAGCKYVIIGHSERRRFGESDVTINKKIKKAISFGLNVIFCVGETKEEREKGRTFEAVSGQLKIGLGGVSKNLTKNIIIAYEPVWAINPGKPCLYDDAMTMNIFIKKNLVKIFGKNFSQKIRIIYGGSVDSQNAKDYIEKTLMKGLLVGSASLTEDFIKIAKKI